MSLLYTRFAPRMLALIRRYVDDLNDAQDILHDGFIVAFTRLDSLRNPERIDFWLATIMRNLALKFLNSRDIAQLLHELPDIEDQKEVEDLLDLDLLVSMVDSLPTGYQNVFRLAVFENKSHKEISKILGIAPNSSSSQLFRAKLQLRQIINNYKTQVGILSLLLLAAAPGIIYLLCNNESIVKKGSEIAQYATQENRTEASDKSSQASTQPNKPLPIMRKSNRSVANNRRPAAITAPMDSIYNTDAKAEDSQPDSLATEPYPFNFNNESLYADEDAGKNDKDSVSITSYEDYWMLYAELDEPLPIPTEPETDQWSFSLAFSSGAFNPDSSQNNYMGSNPGGTNNPGDSNTPGHNPGNNGGDQSVDFNGTDSSNQGTEEKEDDNVSGSNDKKEIAKSARSEERPLKEQPHRNHLPLSFALTAQKRINSWLGLETGLIYTYLHTTFEESNSATECHWHYIGIPLKLNMNIYSAPRFRIYGSVACSFHYPVNSHASRKHGIAGYPYGSFKSYPTMSLGAGIGISYTLSRRIDLYFEPALQYRLPSKYEVPNIWTDEPWGLTLPIGIRFKW